MYENNASTSKFTATQIATAMPTTASVLRPERPPGKGDVEMGVLTIELDPTTKDVDIGGSLDVAVVKVEGKVEVEVGPGEVAGEIEIKVGRTGTVGEVAA